MKCYLRVFNIAKIKLAHFNYSEDPTFLEKNKIKDYKNNFRIDIVMYTPSKNSSILKIMESNNTSFLLTK